MDSSKGPPRKNIQKTRILGFVRSMEKIASDGPKQGQEDVFPTNPDLADILGRTDLKFENFHFSHFVDPKFLDFPVPRFPKFGLGLGRAWTLKRPNRDQISQVFYNNLCGLVPCHAMPARDTTCHAKEVLPYSVIYVFGSRVVEIGNVGILGSGRV